MSSNGHHVDGITPVSTDQASLLRKCFVGLAVISVTGTILELAFERHWKDIEQMIPWFSIGAFLIALLVFLVRPTVGGIRAARAIIIPVALSAVFGVYEHMHENFKAGFLDFRYSKKWKTMSFFSHWWTAFTKSVGPAPTLAPGVLAFSCLCLFLATLRHPAFAVRARKAVVDKRAALVDLTDDSYPDDVSDDVSEDVVRTG